LAASAAKANSAASRSFRELYTGRVVALFMSVVWQVLGAKSRPLGLLTHFVTEGAKASGGLPSPGGEVGSPAVKVGLSHVPAGAGQGAQGKGAQVTAVAVEGDFFGEV